MVRLADHRIKLSNLSVGYYQGSRQKKVLSNLNLSIFAGEIIALLGLNGSGKSTLLRGITRLQAPLSGEITLNNLDLNKWSKNDLAKQLSYVSTEIISNNNLHVFDLVALGRYPHTSWTGHLSDNDRKIIYNSIRSVGIEGFTYTRINELSDGEKQRAMIARALAQDTPVIILDEPTAFLDIPHRYEIFRLLAELSLKMKKSIVISTHDLNIAIQEADKLWLVSNGNITEGSPEDLVINNSISQVFGSESVIFNHENGNFIVPRKKRFTISLSGKGTVATWTIRALERLEFEVVCNKTTAMSVAINQSGNEFKWVLKLNAQEKTFSSIYELTTYLKSINLDNYG